MQLKTFLQHTIICAKSYLLYSEVHDATLRHGALIYQDCVERPHAQHQHLSLTLGLPLLLRSPKLPVSTNFEYHALMLLTTGGGHLTHF